MIASFPAFAARSATLDCAFVAPQGRVGTSSPYRGDDRRCVLVEPDRSILRPLILGAIALLSMWAGVTLGGGIVAQSDALDVVLLVALLESTGAALAVVLALLCIVRWRVLGEGSALWAGVALLLYGTVTVGFTGLLPLVLSGGVANGAEGVDVTVLGWLRPASRLVVIGLLTVAAVGPAVDSRLRFTPLLAASLSGMAVLTVVFHLAPGSATIVTSHADALPGATVGAYGPWVVMAAYGSLAGGLLLRSSRDRRPLLGWLGLLVATLALAEATRHLTVHGPAMWSLGAQVLRLTGFGAGLAGVLYELQHAYQRQGRDLLQSVLSTATAEARIRATRHETEERVHEARNALMAIEGATQTLERYRERLDPATRESLAAAVSAEIARLQRLASTDRLDEDRALMNVAETLAPVVTGARAQGVDVLVDVPEDLTAYGRWADIAEVVQNLVENARRYAPGSPVALRARQDGDQVLVRVEDRGPGVPTDQREDIFRRGVRGRAHVEQPGTGLGLYVSAKLMREQEGDLWLEDRRGGGATFVVALPAVEPSPAAEPLDDTAVRGANVGQAALDESYQPFHAVHRNGVVGDPHRPATGRIG